MVKAGEATDAVIDDFGAHTYRRTDREGTFHTAWAEPKGACPVLS